MISKSFIAALIFAISLASHATISCDWLLLSEKVEDSERSLLDSVEALWSAELQKFRALQDQDAQVEHLKMQALLLENKLKERAERPAVHFNLHGGDWLNYLKEGGIKATQGDSGLQYGISRDAGYKVYFFNLDKAALYTVLTTRNPNHIFLRRRMGDSVIFFDLASKELEEYRESKLIEYENAISINFGPRKGDQFYGVPYKSFITHPLRLFDGAHKGMGPRRLSYNEQTLFALVMLGQALNRPWSW